jgi:DNA repair exonuclease SbcCD ATPase subunit
MRIKKIEWKNFSSYGNKKQTLDFPETPSLFQIVGENGAGKTTISQVISFCLYGKVEGKKLGDIPNRINGNTWTRIEFESNQKYITVERGIEPSLFTLYIDGVKYDQAGTKNIQDYLTDDLIGIPYYVFNNTISLSINDFKSFVKMSPQDKRAIVDKIFGFHILNQMRETLKNEFKKIKDSLNVSTAKIETIEKNIEKSNLEMNSLLDLIKEESDDKIKVLRESMKKFSEIQSIHSQKVQEFKSGEGSIFELVTKANRNLIESKTEYQALERRLKLYENKKCPTCEGSLDDDFHVHAKAILIKDKSTSQNKLEESENELAKMKILENDIRKKKQDLYEKGLKIDTKIKEIKREIEKENSDTSDKQLDSLKKIISDLEIDLNEIQSTQIKTDEKNLWLKKMDDVLGEKGVKQMAIKTILPSLNSEILDLLGAMNLEYQVVFDDEFKASIFHMGIEIPIQTLSTGEMKKVDFVVLIAIMKLMKLKFSTINLLFLDELFSSVDPDGVHGILKILKKNTREMGLNIFVINHAPMPHEIFDWKLDVSKSNNFSSISINKF